MPTVEGSARRRTGEGPANGGSVFENRIASPRRLRKPQSIQLDAHVSSRSAVRQPRGGDGVSRTATPVRRWTRQHAREGLRCELGGDGRYASSNNSIFNWRV